MRKRLLLFVVAALVWSVSARVNAQERISLQEVKFSTYDGWGPDAKKIEAVTPAWEMGVPSGCPYGDPNIDNGADLSAFSKMYVTVSPESEGLRIMMNRKVREGQCADTEEASNLISIPSHAWCTQKYCTIEGNTYIIDLAKILKDQGFVRLHAIKGPSWNTQTTILSVELERAVVKQVGWTQITTNADLEGDDMSSFMAKIAPAGADILAAPVVDEVGVNGSRGIELKVPAKASQTWDSQFWIVLPQPLPEGTKYRVFFDAKASVEVTPETQAHRTPGDYIHHEMLSPNPAITTEWQTFKYEGTLTTSQAGGGTFQSIAFNLAVLDSDFAYYFDNIRFEVFKNEVSIEPNDTVRVILSNELFTKANANTIPMGYTVYFGTEVREGGSNQDWGPRVYNFAAGGDFTKGLYFREGRVEYGYTEGYELNFEAGKSYNIHFNTAMWKGDGYTKFEILNELDEIVYEQLVQNNPNVNASTAAVFNSTSVDIKFQPEATGKYFLKWWNSDANLNTAIYSEALLANVYIFTDYTIEDIEREITSKRQYLLAYVDSLGELGYTAIKNELLTLIGDGSSVENTLESKRAELARLNNMNTIGEEVFELPQMVEYGESLIINQPLVLLSEAIATAKKVLENKATSTSDNFVKVYGELATACQTWHICFDNIDTWNFNTSTTIGDFEVLLDVNSKMASIYRYRGTSADLEIPESITYNNDFYPVVGVGPGKANDYWSSGAICDSLTSVTLPETLRFIGRSAFNGCAELDSLVVPEYVTWIGSSAFNGTSLNELHVKATVPPVCEGNLSPIYIVYVPEGCGNAYWDSDYWKDCAIVPGAGINLFITLQEPGTLGELILQQTEYLRNVNSLKIAGNVNETDMQIIGRLQGLISVDMSELTMKSLPNRLFEGRKALTSVKLPATLESIGQYAFSECAHLYSIELPETLKRIEWYAFNNSSIASIDLPEGLNYLGQTAFHNCDNLEEITIPAGVKTIEGSTFSDCNRLKKVVCLEGLERISGNAFGWCYELESVTLPSTLKQCDNAFNECRNMKQIICYAMLPPACNEKYIVTGPDECALYVPEWTINKYKLAAGWTEFYPIRPIGVLPEDITVYEDFKLTLPDSIPAGYKPNMNVGVNGYDGKDMYGNVGVELQLDGKDTLAVKNFQMNYGYYAGERWNGNNHYWDYYYNGSQLLNNVEGMQADSVTLLLSVPSGRWSFVSFPFDVKVSDIVPADSNTRWIIRRYAGDLRAKQDFANAWQNLTADSILRAGEGYIWHCAGNSYNTRIFTLPALKNANMNNLFATDTLKVELGYYPAELAHNQGWNLVGNPFPTHYDSRALNFSAPITVWNGNTYVAYSIVDDDYVLMPGEAFFVQSAVEKEQVVFPAEGRQLFDSVRANPSYAPQVVTRSAAPRRVFNLLLNGDAQVDRTRFVINPEAKSSYELSRDASKFMSDNQDAAQLYTIEGEVNYAINERPMGNGEIALGAQFGQRGEYTIALNTNVSDTEVVLVDMLTGVETDLGVRSYTFEAEAGTVTNRFLIKLNAGLGATALHKNLAATTQVTSVNGQVMVRTAEDTEVALYTVDGKLLQKAQGTQTAFQVPAGFYVVKVQNLVYKVAVTK